jgi:HEAT repeat protein
MASAIASGQSDSKTTEISFLPALSTSAWETLDRGLQHGEAEFRQKAITAVGTIGSEPKAVGKVTQLLHDKNTFVRQKAAATLGEMGSPEAIPGLQAALDDDEPEVSFAAAKSLATLGDPSAREILLQVMEGERKDRPGFIQAALRNAKHRLTPAQLALMGAKQAAALFPPSSIGLELAQEIAKDSKKSSGAAGRVIAAGLLAKDPDPNNIAVLEWALGDDSSTVRAAVAEALGKCGTRDTIPKLAPLMSDDSHAVRYMAAAAIVKLNLQFDAAR